MQLPDPRETLSRWILPKGLEIAADLEQSRGAYLYDTRTGDEFLDFFSFFASRPLGFNHRKLNTPELIEKLGKVALHKPSNCDVYTPQYAEFTDKFCRIALGEKFRHVFFIEGGSPAVENALKAAIDWKHLKNLEANRGERGSQIIHFQQCFHGRTGYALSLTDSPDPRKTRYFPKFPWPRVINPKMRFPFNDAAKAEVEELEAQALGEIDRALTEHEHDVAAIIIEPIQGEGGDNYFRPELMQALRRIADEREVMLIFDEVQTGFGSTGAWWDWHNLDVQPDLMVFGKKTGVCGFAATDRINEVEGVFRTPSRISSTFEGNLVDMVRCSAVIDIIQEDDLIGNARLMGTYLLKVLGDLAAQYEVMTNVRGRGLWAAFDVPSGAQRDELIQACFTERLLVMGCGEQSVRLRPALDISADAVGRCAAQLEVALKRVFS